MTTTRTELGAGVVDAFLEAVAGGWGPGRAALYTPDATLDATVPNWRFSVAGAEAIASQYATWFRHPGRFEEVERRASPDGEVVTFLLTWEEEGVPHAAHHCHVLSLAADGRIAADRVFCGGRWPAALLAEMGAAGHAG